MATGFQLRSAVFSGICLVCIQGVLADDGYNIGGLVASSAVSILLLALVIGVIVAGATWNSWYPQLQLAKGRVKMPQAYWRKREEAKLRLLHGSRSGLTSLAAPSESGLPNGNTTSRVRDTGSLNASWVQGWNNAHAIPMDDGGYEEMALAMELGEEKEEEVRIETTVVDNETLDLGPFRDTDTNPTATRPPNRVTSAPVPAAGGVVAVGGVAAGGPSEMSEDPADSYIYSTVDRSNKKPASRADDAARTGPSVGGIPATSEEEPAATSEKVTSFSKMDPYLVAL